MSWIKYNDGDRIAEGLYWTWPLRKRPCLFDGKCWKGWNGPIIKPWFTMIWHIPYPDAPISHGKAVSSHFHPTDEDRARVLLIEPSS